MIIQLVGTALILNSMMETFLVYLVLISFSLEIIYLIKILSSQSI